MNNVIPQGSYNQALFVGSVLADVFGVNSPIYFPNAWFKQKTVFPQDYKPETPNDYSGYNIKQSTYEYAPEIKIIDDSEVKSIFGTPVVGTIEFLGGHYNMYNRFTGKLEKARYSDYTLPYSCIVDFSRDAVITETQTLGGTGTVKELYGLSDWQITIRGVAFNGSARIKDETAHQAIRSLKQWSDLSDSISVKGDIFAAKDIDNIVIKSFSVQPIVAKYNVIPFTIEAVSDEPIELII